MATNRTTNYALNLWEPQDAFLREEFNENFTKIDTKLTRIVTGSYRGTGTYGPDHPTVIEVPDAERPPSVIIVTEDDNYRFQIFIRGTTKRTLNDFSMTHSQDVIWTDKGLKCHCTKGAYQQFNDASRTYHYIALI